MLETKTVTNGPLTRCKLRVFATTPRPWLISVSLGKERLGGLGSINVSILLPAAPPDAAGGWPAYCFTSDNEKVTRIFHSPCHQPQLILFSLGL